MEFYAMTMENASVKMSKIAGWFRNVLVIGYKNAKNQV
jgi:hypothetical protein